MGPDPKSDQGKVYQWLSKIILVEAISKWTVWQLPLHLTSRYKQLASVLFHFFELVFILTLLMCSFSFIAPIPSSLTGLCIISAVHSNINHNPTSVPSVSYYTHNTWWCFVCCCWVCNHVYFGGCTVAGESVCTDVVLFTIRQKILFHVWLNVIRCWRSDNIFSKHLNIWLWGWCFDFVLLIF